MVQVQIINKSNNPTPAYQTLMSAGMDIYGNNDSEVVIPAFGRALIKTGLFMALPQGYEAQIRPRSGLAYKQGLTVLNSPGTIDADYRDEIGVLLYNSTTEPITVPTGERIAQMVIAQHEFVQWDNVLFLDETTRNGGWGSTGTK